MLRLATKIEKTRGMAKGGYIAPSYGDDKDEIARILIDKLKRGKKVVIILNAKKETSYLFADILNIPYDEINPENKPFIIANLDENVGLPRIRQHAINIKEELKNKGVKADVITGGLDEYPVTGKAAINALRDIDADFVIAAGVPHALPIETLNVETLAITDGPRLVEPLKELGYKYVVTELDAHSKTLGVDKIVASDFGEIIRKNLHKE
jgi:putative methanogenesis marker 13 metalloprotein